MKQRLVVILLCLALFTYSSILKANAYDASGYFLGFSAGAGDVYVDKSFFSKIRRNSFFAHPYVGYNLSQNMGVLFGYIYLPTLKQQANSVTTTDDSKGLNANLRFRYAIASGWLIYGDLGAALMTSQVKQNNIALKQHATVLNYGAGFDYVFPEIGGFHMTVGFIGIEQKTTKTVTVPGITVYGVGIYYQF